MNRASPVDKIWGIGLAEDHEFASVPQKWKGLNLLGYALMTVRDQLLQNA
nr:NADAR domain-containing protein [Pseudoalteromonas rubra]